MPYIGSPRAMVARTRNSNGASTRTVITHTLSQKRFDVNSIVVADVFAIALLLAGESIVALPPSPRIATTWTAACFWLLTKPRHRLRLSPAGTGQIGVMLIAIFFQSTVHMAIRLMPTGSSTMHDYTN